MDKPRSRRKDRGPGKEVAVAAYEAMQEGTAMRAGMLGILLHGVLTRRYQEAIPQMADTVGVSKSSVGRPTIEASEAATEQLLSRRFDDPDPLVIYLDGLFLGEQCVIAAVGAGEQRHKYVLRVRGGAP